MLDALCEQLSTKNISTYIVYMPEWNTTKLRPTHTNITLGHGRVRFVKLLWAAFRSSGVVVVGADVLDGAYGEWMPVRWIGKLTRANKIGRSVGFINFSFSPDADPAISERLRATGGLRFTSRDPVSFARFTRATGQPATLSADLAFLLSPELRAPNAVEADRWLAARKAAGDTILFVNLSGHALARMDGDGVAVMEDMLRQWLRASAARSIFLVPHDFRPAPTGDVEVLERLRAPLAAEFPDRVAMIWPPFDAWDVKALCGQADLAVSGRMHLTIACFGMGVPVVSVVYVGKFEGLMQHFGLADEDLLIEPNAIQADSILSRIERVTAQRDRLSAIIRSRLDAVKALSARNFDWL